MISIGRAMSTRQTEPRTLTRHRQCDDDAEWHFDQEDGGEENCGPGRVKAFRAQDLFEPADPPRRKVLPPGSEPSS